MSNVNPRVLELVLASLPVGAVIQSGAAESPEKAVFVVQIGEETKRVTMPKVDVARYLSGQRAEVMASEGDSWEDVMAAVSAKYRLYLAPGVDYEVDPGTVQFGVGGTLSTGVYILDTSIHVKGALTITVKDKAKFDRPKIAVCCPLGEQKAQLALVSKAFPTAKVILIGAGGLGKDFVQSLAAELIHHTIEGAPSVSDMLVAEVVDLINDGVSDVAVFRTEGGRLWFVRYRLLASSEKKKKSTK